MIRDAIEIVDLLFDYCSVNFMGSAILPFHLGFAEERSHGFPTVLGT